MQVLLCGEGKHEIGDSKHWDERLRDYVLLDGWMKVLARRLCPQAAHATIEMRNTKRIVFFPRDHDRYKPLPKGHGAKALAAKLAAAREGFHVVVFMVDTDSPEKAIWRKIRDEILTGFARVDNGVIGLACVPMSASESWLLADTEAWCGLGLMDLQSLKEDSPETIWGARNDPQGNHPHRFFTRVCVAASVEDCLETRLTLAEESNLDTIARRCPVSFGGLRKDVTNACRALTDAGVLTVAMA